MKKPLALLLVLCLLLSPLAGCAQSASEGAPAPATEGAPEAPVLRLVHHVEPENTSKPHDVGMGKIFDRFTRETGIEIELVTIAWDQIDRDLVVSTKAGMPSGDLYAASSQQLAYLVNHNALMPLDGYLDASFDRGDFAPLALEAGTYPGDGKLYLMLHSIHTRGLWYNTDYIEVPPETLEELVALAAEVNRPQDGFYGFAFWGGGHYGSVEVSLAPLAWAEGGVLAGEDGRAAFDSEAMKEAIRFYADCVHGLGISPRACLTTRDYVDIQMGFMEGRYAMIMDGNYSYNLYSQAEDPGKFAFAPFPGPEGAAPSFSNGWAWGIPINSAQPELAWRFIEWFEQENVQKEHALLEGSLPTQVALYDEMAGEYPLFRSFEENFSRSGRPMDALVYYQEALQELTIAASSYCLDPATDLDRLLEKAQENYNAKYY